VITEEAFLRAIAAEPHDAGTRLVYADWLEDQGDERAEFIRAVEEMRALPAFSDRYWELRARRDELKPRVRSHWIAALGYNVYQPLFQHAPTERAHRWRLMREFIETWYWKPEDPGNSQEEIEDTEERLGFALPVAMREWYALVGKCVHRLFSTFSGDCCRLHELRLSRDRRSIRFYRTRGHDCHVAWSVLIDEESEDPEVLEPQPDPPNSPITVCRLASPDPTISRGPFSQFVLGLLVLAPVFSRHAISHGGDGDHPTIRHELSQTFRRAKLPKRYGLNRPVHLWEAPDMLCFDTETDAMLRIAARTPAAYSSLPLDVRRLLR
jgi:uncharacterized protein (TIGR02996 family)